MKKCMDGVKAGIRVLSAAVVGVPGPRLRNTGEGISHEQGTLRSVVAE
jgi:hypothetical protein